MEVNFMKENVKFVIKVAVIHLLTYIVCGMIFASVFDYEHLFKLGNAQYYMKDAYSFHMTQEDLEEYYQMMN